MHCTRQRRRNTLCVAVYWHACAAAGVIALATAATTIAQVIAIAIAIARTRTIITVAGANGFGREIAGAVSAAPYAILASPEREPSHEDKGGGHTRPFFCFFFL